MMILRVAKMTLSTLSAVTAIAAVVFAVVGASATSGAGGAAARLGDSTLSKTRGLLPSYWSCSTYCLCEDQNIVTPETTSCGCRNNNDTTSACVSCQDGAVGFTGYFMSGSGNGVQPSGGQDITCSDLDRYIGTCGGAAGCVPAARTGTCDGSYPPYTNQIIG